MSEAHPSGSSFLLTSKQSGARLTKEQISEEAIKIPWTFLIVLIVKEKSMLNLDNCFFFRDLFLGNGHKDGEDGH